MSGRAGARSATSAPERGAIHRLAVLGGGALAVRVIQSAREVSEEGYHELRTIALYDEAEATSLFVREANGAFPLRPAHVRAWAARTDDGVYVDLACVEAALVTVRADALFVDCPLPEARSALVEVCERLGVCYIGSGGDRVAPPSVETWRQLAMECELSADARPEGMSVRQLEIGVLAGESGIWVFGVKECSLHHNGVSVVIESGSPALDDTTVHRLRAFARRLCEVAGHRGAGQVELMLTEDGNACFVALRPGLSPGFGVDEMTTGLDLVKLELRVAGGGRLSGEPPHPRGYAIEADLRAEDPAKNFATAPGRIELLRMASGPGIRVETAVAEGDFVAAERDPVVARVIAWGQDRKEALSRLRRALKETVCVLVPAATNRLFLLGVLATPQLRAGGVCGDRLQEITPDGPARTRHGEIALLLAAAEIDESDAAVERARFFSSAVRGIPHVPDRAGRDVDLRLGGRDYRLHVDRLGPCTLSATLDGRRVEFSVDRLNRFERRLDCPGGPYRGLCVGEGTALRVEVEDTSHTIGRADGGLVRAPAPAVLVSLGVAVGDVVAQGDVLAVLEAMKLETPLRAPHAGTISQIFVAKNVQVGTGTPLLVIEPGSVPPAESDGGLRFELPATSLQAADDDERAAGGPIELLRSLMLGYDVDAAAAQAALDDHEGATPARAERTRRGELDVLRTFADVAALARRRPDVRGDAEQSVSLHELFLRYLRGIDNEVRIPALAAALRDALAHYDVRTLERSDRLEEALFRIACSHERSQGQVPVVVALLGRLLETAPEEPSLLLGEEDELRQLLDRLHAATRHHHPAVAELTREVRHRLFDAPLIEAARQETYGEVESTLEYLTRHPTAIGRAARVSSLVECPQPLHNLLCARFNTAGPGLRGLMLEVMTRRYYRHYRIGDVAIVTPEGRTAAVASLPQASRDRSVVTTFALVSELAEALVTLGPVIAALPTDERVVVDAYLWTDSRQRDVDVLAKQVREALGSAGMPPRVRRVVAAVTGPGYGTGMDASQHLAFHRLGGRFREERLYRSLHPMMAERLQLWRLRNFRLERLPSVEDLYVFHGVARSNPADERLFAIAEVRDLTPELDAKGTVIGLPQLECMLREAFASVRFWQSQRPLAERLHQNRVMLYVWPPLVLSPREIQDIVRRLEPETDDLGLEKIVVRARLGPPAGPLRDSVLQFSNPTGAGVSMLRFDTPAMRPIEALTPYAQKALATRRRGLVYPYDIVTMLTPSPDQASDVIAPGTFVEHDLDTSGALVPVERPYGENTANLVVGVIANFTWKYPEGMSRVSILGDPSRSLGALAEAECRRIIAALDLADAMGVPLEWFTLSSGAKISMDSGTENMDWIARVLRRIVKFTQAGGEINLVVNGINVGAQPYWNAEATMLMHTRGILVMTPDGAMVLTGKQALQYSGGVAAEDNFGIGGYERVMGPNGEAQYFAPDLLAACEVLLRHYEHTYRMPGERFPRRAATTDAFDRDVRESVHPRIAGTEFTSVGEIFSDERNPARKKPFDIRAVMAAVVDQDHLPLERWGRMLHAGMAVVWDAHLGGFPVCLVGIESRPFARLGFVPADGPDHWTSGTLFPQSSKKVARAVNAASGNRPLVVLGNLSGFDGSPESMRRLQLEFGAEIGRAIVNFQGPVVFCVVSRYHGGAFVVFSQALNDSMEVAAIEGSYASVIGGAPAAAVVFAHDVEARARSDPRVLELTGSIEAATGPEKRALRARVGSLLDEVRGEKLGEVASEFDTVHSVARAQRVGSVHHIIRAAELRPYLIGAVERGVARELALCGTRR